MDHLLNYKYVSLAEGSLVLWNDKMKIEDDAKKKRSKFMINYIICFVMGVTYFITGIISKSAFETTLGIFMILVFAYSFFKLFRNKSLESTISYRDIDSIELKSTNMFTYNGNNIYNVLIKLKDKRVRIIQIEENRNEVYELKTTFIQYGLKVA